jgi:nucleoid DNA-binding protein
MCNSNLVQQLSQKIEENSGKRLHSEYQAKQYIQIVLDYISNNLKESFE